MGKKEKEKEKRWTVHIEQTKSIVTFTYSPNKCHNIFTKHLFSVVVGHSFIFYYFILTYKKLTPRKKCTNGRLKKKATVATIPLEQTKVIL